MSHVIGIDLGTTNSCVAIVEGGTPTVIANKQGYKTTPSIVAITETGERLVGQIAARQSITNPLDTAYATKRLIGRDFDSEEVRTAQAHVPYRITGGRAGDVRVVLRGKEFSIPEIAAIILQEMRIVAEDYLNDTVDQAVVTVPAYFSDSQRQAVRDAGLIAGLDVLRIVNEPTAAAIAYGFHRGEDKTIAVYDLGGGTFDVSIVRVTRDGTFRVVATTGDSFLGGEDFDERVMEWLLEAFEAEHQVSLRDSPVAMQRLRQAAQKAKCELSTELQTEIQLPFIVTEGPTGPLNMHYRMTREQLEGLTEDLIERTIEICEHALKHANLGSHGVDEVVLVGGQTRMPAVSRAVSKHFGKAPSKSIHPDECVAVGAAIQGAAMLRQIEDVNLEDVTAHSLGIATAGDVFDPIIRANTRVPCRVPSLFTTSRDGQDRLKIVVLEGESKRASENQRLQEFALAGLRSAPAGSVEVEVAFTIDEDGIFSASAKDLETGQETRIEITADGGLSAQELQQLSDEHAEYLELRRGEELLEGLRQSAETLIADLERALDRLGALVKKSPEAQEAEELAREVVTRAKPQLAKASRGELAEHLVLLEDAARQIDPFAR
ncbi:MAG: molecular chaperone DnaK [Myxococcales bacterium]|nr:molecular chaperone DnaK [Myxococcales bacterium]MCB9628746.1 molecular chaperone DnaK [Sandaracinaceae bacterium]